MQQRRASQLQHTGSSSTPWLHVRGFADAYDKPLMQGTACIPAGHKRLPFLFWLLKHLISDSHCAMCDAMMTKLSGCVEVFTGQVICKS